MCDRHRRRRLVSPASRTAGARRFPYLGRNSASLAGFCGRSLAAVWRWVGGGLRLLWPHFGVLKPRLAGLLFRDATRSPFWVLPKIGMFDPGAGGGRCGGRGPWSQRSMEVLLLSHRGSSRMDPFSMHAFGTSFEMRPNAAGIFVDTSWEALDPSSCESKPLAKAWAVLRW